MRSTTNSVNSRIQMTQPGDKDTHKLATKAEMLTETKTKYIPNKRTREQL